MAIDHLDALRDEVPDLFETKPPPLGFGEDLVVIGVDDIFEDPAGELRDIDDLVGILGAYSTGFETDGPLLPPAAVIAAPGLPNAAFPGAPNPTSLPSPSVASTSGQPVSPPDSLAFYLPYHYYHPQWWGVYVTIEGVAFLSQVFQRYGCGSSRATKAARYFLYLHEFFHHKAESFATRLEVILGYPAYRAGIQRRFSEVFGTDDCLEEALANGYAYVQLKRLLSRDDDWAVLDQAVQEYIHLSGPGYRMGLNYLAQSDLSAGEDDLSEEYLHHVIGNPSRNPLIWRMFSHALTGTTTQKGRANYVISRHSPLIDRLSLRGRLLSYRKLREQLKRDGCEKIREGGAHEIWRCPNGKTAPLPRHRGDIPLGTAKAIMKQFGQPLNFSQLLAL